MQTHYVLITNPFYSFFKYFKSGIWLYECEKHISWVNTYLH